MPVLCGGRRWWWWWCLYRRVDSEDRGCSGRGCSGVGMQVNARCFFVPLSSVPDSLKPKHGNPTSAYRDNLLTISLSRATIPHRMPGKYSPATNSQKRWTLKAKDKISTPSRLSTERKRSPKKVARVGRAASSARKSTKFSVAPARASRRSRRPQLRLARLNRRGCTDVGFLLASRWVASEG